MAMLVAATRNLPKVIGMSRLPISPNLSRSNPTMLTLMSGVVLRNLAKAIGAVHWPIPTRLALITGKSFQWTNDDSRKTAKGVKPTAKEWDGKQF
jgi:hypothetical protein